MSDPQEAPKAERVPLYFRLTNDIPAMVWPSADGEEAIVQIGRERPRIVSRYAGKDQETMNVVIIDLLARTKALVSSGDWHHAMGSETWPDGASVIWSRPDV